MAVVRDSEFKLFRVPRRIDVITSPTVYILPVTHALLSKTRKIKKTI